MASPKNSPMSSRSSARPAPPTSPAARSASTVDCSRPFERDRVPAQRACEFESNLHARPSLSIDTYCGFPLRRPLARRWINLLGDAASLQSQGEAAPTKYWLSTPPSNISFRQLVDFAKPRWRIERDYQELKQEVGLGHYLATVD